MGMDQEKIHAINSSQATQFHAADHILYKCHRHHIWGDAWSKKCQPAKSETSEWFGREMATQRDGVIKQQHWSVKEVVFWRLSNEPIYIRGVVTFLGVVCVCGGG